MALPSGTRLGPYEIIAIVGAGGMGEVYRSRDTRLGRDVALKILPPALCEDPARVRRFAQEARAAGKLNHPNILAVYDTGTHEGMPYVVSELLEGATLRDRLRERPLPVRKTLELALQVARGLAAAHRKGIVHRDLKPENLFLTADGLVKILDFGLAKLTHPEERAAIDSGSPTVSMPTEPGTVLGTPAYMSPEQVRGEPADHRSDIFSFGTIAYEMVSGKRPFHGQTSIETLSAILNAEPGELSLAEEPGLERIVRRCLEKNPDERFQAASDLVFDLEGLRGTGSVPAPAARGRGRRAARPILAFAVLAMAAGWAASRWMGPSPPPSDWKLTRLTSDSGLATDPALSADGKLLAYASDQGGEGNLDIWVRQVGGGEPLRLTRNEADDREPDFSPDGRRVAFRSEREGGGIYVVPALGGEERRIADGGRRPRFSPDGEWLAFWTGETGSDFSRTGGSKTYVIAVNGGTPRQIRPDFAATRYPVWSPDGKSLLVLGVRDWQGPWESIDWWTTPFAVGDARRTGACKALAGRDLSCFSTPGAWIAPDRILFAGLDNVFGNNTNIWQLALSGSGQVVGAPRRLTSGTTVEASPSAAGSQAGNPRWAFASLSENLDIWSLPFPAKGGTTRPEKTGELQRLTDDIAEDVQPALSGDGRRLVFASRRWGNWDVWMKNLESGKESALTMSPLHETHPAISRDGTRVAYLEGESGPKSALFLVSIDAMGRASPVERICDGCFVPWDLSPDGTRLLYWSGGLKRIGRIDLTSGRREDILQHPENALLRSHYSPDGRWIAFHSINGPGVTPIMLAPANEVSGSDSREWLVLLEGKTGENVPRWSPDGALLYFLSERDGFRCLWAQRLEPTAKTPFGPAVPVHHFHRARRSLKDVPFQFLEMGVATDKIVLPLAERTGNIWMASH